MQTKQIDLLLQQLKLLYPAAFKRNYLFYGQIKTKGILSDLKELIPWVLAAMIFVPISLALKDVYSSKLSTAQNFQAQSYAILTILLFLMLVVPLVIKQIRHSSHSLYQFLRHTPIKLTVVIVLEALNLVFLQSSTVMWILFFFGISFGFVRFYKENMFRPTTDTTEQYQLQQLRRICFWAYQQTWKLRLKLFFHSKPTSPNEELKNQLQHYADLHTRLFKLEHEQCKKIKYIDIDTYLDEHL